MDVFNGTSALIADLWENGVKIYVEANANECIEDAKVLGHKAKDLNVLVKTGISRYNKLSGRPYTVTGTALGYNSINMVHPTGNINIYSETQFNMRAVSKVLSKMWDKLIALSPIGEPDDKRLDHPGLYIKSHVFVLNGQVLQIGAGGLTQAKLASKINQGDKFEFYNTAVYARKFETEFKRQKYKDMKKNKKKKISRRPASTIAPNGVYDVVYKSYGRRNSNRIYMERGFKRAIGVKQAQVIRFKTGVSVDQIYPMISGIIL